MSSFSLRLISFVFVLVLLATTLAGVSFLAVLHHEIMETPPLSTILPRDSVMTSRVYADNGALIDEFSQKNQSPLILDKIPTLVQNAFIAAEDRNFWRHNGIDAFAISRAIIADIKYRKTKKRPLGASTITQQVIKNLTGDNSPTFRRKAREAILAVELERAFGKRSVLEYYLNNIYLGQGAYGVSSAADVYFGKPLDQLDVAEASLLAAMPRGPSNYDPVRSPASVSARRDYVLMRMSDEGFITPEQVSSASQEPLPHPHPRQLAGQAHGYFSEEVRRQIVASLGAKALYRDGLIIKTSMDPRLQAVAETSLRDGLVAYDERHGWRGPIQTIDASSSDWISSLRAISLPSGAAPWVLGVVLGFEPSGSAKIGLPTGEVGFLPWENMKWAISSSMQRRLSHRPGDILRVGDVVLVEKSSNNALFLRQIPIVQGGLIAMESRTGRVVAVAGGFDYAQGSFDRATQSERQPGSTFKPFIYLTAFENGWTPDSPVLDSPIVLSIPGDGDKTWTPGADGGYGWGLITARKALENSRNLASVRLLYDIGLDRVGETARAFSLYNHIDNLSSALGTIEVTDIALTSAYAMIANGGHHIVAGFIDSISDSSGRLLMRREIPLMDERNQIADPVAINELISVLKGVVRDGTAMAALGHLPLVIAGKTGTTNDAFDAWFVGFSGPLAIGVHVGFDEPSSLGEKEFGGTVAAPIFGEFVAKAFDKN